MEGGKNILIILAIIIYDVCAQHETNQVDVNTRLGANLELSCSFANQERRPITWKKNDEMLTYGPHLYTRNPRIKIIRHGTIAIEPLQAEDLGLYICSSEDGSMSRKFNVFLSNNPVIPSDSSCSYQTELNRKMDEVLHQLRSLAEGIRQIESRQDRFEYYIRTGSMGRPEPPTKAYPVYIPHTLPPRPYPATHRPYPVTHRPYPATDRPYPTGRRPVPSGANTPIAKMKFVNRKGVHEYVWVIDNFRYELDKANVDATHLLKTYFLSKVPGYNVTVRLYPNRRNEGYMALFVGVVPGVYDEIISWPFRQPFEMSILSHDPNINDQSMSIQPFTSNCDNRAFERQHYDEGLSCGYLKFLDLREFNRAQYAYLKHGNLHVRIRISDEV